ncbi:MAG: dihydrofolate reductase family protein, partial [Halothece sp. Uz-M2-17]|nr:dihydrofolate reductase family protein [Halothece sp. Uz-M2-17]
GSAMSLRNSDLIAQRRQQQKPDQPIQIVCTRSGNIATDIRFFRQNIPRWLLTSQKGAKSWQSKPSDLFQQIITPETGDSEINWQDALKMLSEKGIENLAILGGGELVAALFAEELLDELWLTVCPVLLGGKTAPTPIEGMGLKAENAQNLKLISVETIDQEVFLHYRRFNTLKQ